MCLSLVPVAAYTQGSHPSLLPKQIYGREKNTNSNTLPLQSPPPIPFPKKFLFSQHCNMYTCLLSTLMINIISLTYSTLASLTNQCSGVLTKVPVKGWFLHRQNLFFSNVCIFYSCQPLVTHYVCKGSTKLHVICIERFYRYHQIPLCQS